jgi:hypothetical protein
MFLGNNGIWMHNSLLQTLVGNASLWVQNSPQQNEAYQQRQYGWA